MMGMMWLVGLCRLPPFLFLFTLTLTLSHRGRGDMHHRSTSLDTRLRGYDGGYAERGFAPLHSPLG